MKTLLLFLLICVSFNGFGQEQKKSNVNLGGHLKKRRVGDLDDILKKKYLRVLTTRNSFDYFIFEGGQYGYEYELINSFVKYLNKKYVKKNELKITFEMVPVNRDQLFSLLLQGRGDIVAAGVSKIKSREKFVSYSRPYKKVEEVILTHKDVSKYKTLEDFAGETFIVRKNSGFYKSLKKINKSLIAKKLRVIRLIPMDDKLEVEELMELVSNKKYDFTVASSHLGEIGVQVFDDLKIVPELSLKTDTEIVWGTRPNTPKLLSELNKFIPTIGEGTFLGNIVKNKYFSNKKLITKRFMAFNENHISPYDDLIKKYSKKYGLNWRLMVSLCYQESRFEQALHNKWGAIGLFQVKQMTANEPYVNIKKIKGLKYTENNIHAGIKYLAWIKNRYFDSIPEMEEKHRVRMALAAYNAGPKTIIDARAKAKAMGLNPNRWFRHVELALWEMGKKEPVLYVSEINNRFVGYSLIGFK